ncbi:hypothetical protein [Thomasclavelia sp.]
MKKILILLNVLILCFSITACSSKNDLTDEQVDLLIEKRTLEEKSNLVQDMKDEGYNFEINPKTLELVASKKKNRFILSPIGSTGNYTLVFSDENGSYEKEENPTEKKVNISDENRETITNLISTLEKFNTNLYTLDSALVGYYLNNREAVFLNRLDTEFSEFRQKLRQAGYSENDYRDDGVLPTWSKVVTSSDGSSRTRTFNMTLGTFIEVSGSLSTQYNWRKNTGRIYDYADYDFNTRSVTSAISLNSKEELTFVIQMQYIKQEFNEELSLINSSIDELNDYKIKIY